MMINSTATCSYFYQSFPLRVSVETEFTLMLHSTQLYTQSDVRNLFSFGEKNLAQLCVLFSVQSDKTTHLQNP